MTRIRSEFVTVLIRWAMVSIVQSWKASLMVFWMRPSVSASMDAVASSNRIICFSAAGTVSLNEVAGLQMLLRCINGNLWWTEYRNKNI